MTSSCEPGWNSFARVNASDRFRKQSAAMGTPLTELLVREAAVQAGMSVLDVACGTGEPAISIASQLAGVGAVVAIDISADPLAVGEQRARQRALSNIRFQVADVHSLPFENERFDRVTCRLGVMFFGNLHKALSEIHRVLKPGGKFVAASWGPMEQPYFEATIGTVLKLCPGLAIPASAAAMFKFGEEKKLTSALTAVGFTSAHADLREVDWNWVGMPEELWDYFQAVTVPFAALLAGIPEEKKTAVDRAVVEEIGKHFDGRQIRFGGLFVISNAVR